MVYLAIVAVLIVALLLVSYKTKNSDAVSVRSSKGAGVITYSKWYRIAICPKCHIVIKDEKQARYYDKCCVSCGHSTGSLFNVSYETVRDMFRGGVFVETQTKRQQVI